MRTKPSAYADTMRVIPFDDEDYQESLRERAKWLSSLGLSERQIMKDEFRREFFMNASGFPVYLPETLQGVSGRS